MQKSKKHWKTVLILVGATAQSILISCLANEQFSNIDVNIAGEVPEAGTILLFGLGAMILRRDNKKNGR